jgi:hypothetical protein
MKKGREVEMNGRARSWRLDAQESDKNHDREPEVSNTDLDLRTEGLPMNTNVNDPPTTSQRFAVNRTTRLVPIQATKRHGARHRGWDQQRYR